MTNSPADQVDDDYFQRKRTFRTGQDHLRALSWSPDGKSIALIGYRLDRKPHAQVFDAEKSRPRFLQADSNFSSISWMPDSKRLVVGLENGSVYVWRIHEGAHDVEEIRTRVRNERRGKVTLAVSPDGSSLAVMGNNGILELWDLPGLSWNRTKGSRSGLGLPRCLIWSPDGSLVAAGLAPGGLAVFDGSSGRPRWVASQPGLGAQNAICWSQEARFLISGGDERTITLWETATGHPIRVLEGHTADITSLTLLSSDSGDVLASASRDGTVLLWSCDRWEIVANLKDADVSAAEQANAPRFADQLVLT